MVSTKQGNNRRRSVRQNNGRRYKSSGVGGLLNRMNVGSSVGFNARTGINAMFSASQIPDNPGYVDFNEPSVPAIPPTPVKSKPKNERFNRRGMMNHKSVGGGGRGTRNHISKPWHGMRIPVQPPSIPPLPSPGNRGFRNVPVPRLNGRPIPPPPIMRPPIPPPMPPLSAGRFGPRPIIPPPGMPMPPPLMPPRGPMRGVPMPPCPIIPRGGGRGPPANGPIRRMKNIQVNRKDLNKPNRRRGPNRTTPRGKKVTTIKKTLNEIVNQYPLDKPWVTNEIKEEHRKKEEIENKLKGKRDDKLFAEFKVQRDKFVNLYEAARLEYIGKHPEQDVEKIMTESDKVKAETNDKAKSNDNQTQTVVNDTPKAEVIEKADDKQKPVEKPKAVVVETPPPPKATNIAKPRVTRSKGKNFSK